MTNIADKYMKATATGERTPLPKEQMYLRPAGPANPYMSYANQKVSGGGVAGGGGGSFGSNASQLMSEVQNLKGTGVVSAEPAQQKEIDLQEQIEKAKATPIYDFSQDALGYNPSGMTAQQMSASAGKQTMGQAGTGVTQSFNPEDQMNIVAQNRAKANQAEMAKINSNVQTSSYYDEETGSWRSGTMPTDPIQLQIEREREAAKQRYNQQQQYIADVAQQQARQAGEQARATAGMAGMRLARMGAASAGSGVAYMQGLEAQHQQTLRKINSAYQDAIIQAQDMKDAKLLELSQQSIQRAQDLAKQAQEERKAQQEQLEFVMKMEEMSRKAAREGVEDWSSLSSAMADSGVEFSDLPEGYAEQKFGLDTGTAQAIFESTKIQREMENLQKEADTQIKLNTIGLHAYNIASKVADIASRYPRGTTFNIGDTEYVGLSTSGIKTGIETNNQGIATLWSFNPATGEYETRNLGKIGGAKDGYTPVFDPFTNEPFMMNNQNHSYYVGGSQTNWEEIIPEGSYGDQCGVFCRNWAGVRFPDTFEGKSALVDPEIGTDENPLLVGDVFVMSAGSTGHVGIINNIAQDPNGKTILTISESNWGKDEKVSHTRQMYADDPRIAGYIRGQLDNKLKTGPDAPSKDLKYAPSFEDMRVKHPNITQEEYSQLAPAINAIPDAARNISLGLTDKKSQSFINDIAQAFKQGDYERAQEKLMLAARQGADAETRRQLLGRDKTIKALSDIQTRIDDYVSRGGKMNIFEGGVEDIQKKVGKIRNPELRDIATRIQAAIIDYRKAVSGAAFTESEGKQYEDLFPSTGNVPALNKQIIESLVSVLDMNQEVFYRSAMGDNNYEAIFE